MRGLMTLVVLVGAVSPALADCEAERQAYQQLGTVAAADALIKCLDKPPGGPGVTPAVGSPTVGPPTVGGPRPGGPSYDELAKSLSAFRAQYEISDYTWSSLMAASMASSENVTLVYDLSRLNSGLASEQAFVVDPADPANLSATTQIFVQPDQLRAIESLDLGALR